MVDDLSFYQFTTALLKISSTRFLVDLGDQLILYG